MVNQTGCLDSFQQHVFNKTYLSPYLDATGRPQSGFLEGNRAWLGHFQECQSLPDALYCLIDLQGTTSLVNSAAQNETSSIFWGVCAFKSCNSTTLEENIDEIINGTIGPIEWIDVNRAVAYCSNKPEPSHGFYVTVGILGLLSILLLYASLSEIVRSLRKIPKLVYRSDEQGAHLVNPDGSLDDSTHTPPDVQQGWSRAPSKEVLNLAFKPPPGKLSQILESFSLVANLEQLGQSSASAIPCLDGLRVLSMFWIILGHTFLGSSHTGVVDNPKATLEYLQSFFWQPIGNAYFAVDTFFFLSGLLVCYIGLRQLSEGKFCLPAFYVHRYLRLTPAVGLLMLLWVYVVPWLADGPMWFEMVEQPTCQHYWWSNLLYIQNFYPVHMEEICTGWVWYLAMDTQFYLISPLVFLLLHQSVQRGAFVASILIVASVLTTLVLIVVYKIDTDLTWSVVQQDANAANLFEDVVYGKPYCRISPYLIGMIMGYVLYRDANNQIHLGKWRQLAGWLLSAVCLFLLLFAFYPRYLGVGGPTYSYVVNIIHGSFGHLAWSLVLAWIVYVCFYGYGGPIGRLLSWSGWSSLSRLTFGAYMLHPVVMFVCNKSLQTNIHIDNRYITMAYFGFLSLAYILALFQALLIELPLLKIERVVRSWWSR